MMAVSFISGCGTKSSPTNNGNKATSTSANSEQSSTEGESGSNAALQPITVKIALPGDASVIPNTKEPFFEEIAKKTGVSFSEITFVTAPYVDKYSVLINAGDLPDVFMIAGVDADTINSKLSKTGNLLNYKEYLNQMPNFNKYVTKYEDEFNVLLRDKEQNLYVAGVINDFEMIDVAPLYRKDIFDKNKITIPKSNDELYQTLKTLKSIYPGSYPLTVFQGNTNGGGIHDLLGKYRWGGYMFNSDTGVVYDKTSDKYVYSPAKPEFREALEYFKKLYDEELLDPEFISANGADMWVDKIVNEKSFIGFWYIDYSSRVNPVGRENNPDFHESAFAPITKDGSKPKFRVGYSTTANGMCISTKSPYKDRLIEFVDWLYSDEGIAMIGMGLEDITYEKDTSASSGSFPYRFTSAVRTYDNPDGKAVSELIKSPTYASFVNITSVFPAFFFSTLYGSSEIGKDKDFVRANCDIADKEFPPSFTTAQNDERVRLESTLLTFVEENATNFLIGRKSMDKYDDFLKQLESLGYKKLEDIYNTAAKN